MRLLLAGLVLAAAAFTAGGARAQSFPCRHAHFADERAICREASLGRLDDRLAAEYNRVASRLSRRERRRLRAAEDRWVVARRRCGGDTGCIADSYRERMAELADLRAGRERHAPNAAGAAATAAPSVEPEVGIGSGSSAGPLPPAAPSAGSGWINPAPGR